MIKGEAGSRGEMRSFHEEETQVREFLLLMSSLEKRNPQIEEV